MGKWFWLTNKSNFSQIIFGAYYLFCKSITKKNWRLKLHSLQAFSLQIVFPLLLKYETEPCFNFAFYSNIS